MMEATRKCSFHMNALLLDPRVTALFLAGIDTRELRDTQ